MTTTTMKNPCCVLLAISAVLLASVPVRAQEDSERNGMWWVQLQMKSPENAFFYKVGYAIGFIDGWEQGHRSGFGEALGFGAAKPAALSAFSGNVTLHNGVTAGQLVDGLDDFYRDYRNRRIRVGEAIEGVVLPVIKGLMTPDEAEQVAQYLRRGNHD